MARCDDKRVTRRVLSDAGLRIPRGITVGDEATDVRIPQRGRCRRRQTRSRRAGSGDHRGVTNPESLRARIAEARAHCPDVLIEEAVNGQDLRVLVIDHKVVAAAVRRPASVLGDGTHTIEQLIERQSRRRAAATGGESRIPIDRDTADTVAEAGWSMDDDPAGGSGAHGAPDRQPAYRGTIHDVTSDLHPALAEASVATKPGAGDPGHRDRSVGDRARSARLYVIIEANERPRDWPTTSPSRPSSGSWICCSRPPRRRRAPSSPPHRPDAPPGRRYCLPRGGSDTVRSVTPLEIDLDFLRQVLLELLDIPQPDRADTTMSSNTSVSVWTCWMYRSPSLGAGAIVADLGGPSDTEASRAVVVHTDTIGAMIRNLKSNGRLGSKPVGHHSARFSEGAGV